MRFVIREIKVLCPHCGGTVEMDPELVQFLAESRVKPVAPVKSVAHAKKSERKKFDRRAYMREYNRRKRAEKKGAKK